MTNETVGHQTADRFEIRAPRAEDLAPVLELLGDAILPRAGVAEQFGDAYAVAVAGGRVIGAAGVERHGGNGLLRSVVVDRSQRGRGVGEALVRDRLGWSAAAGLEAVYLLTTDAAGWFERFGFERIERSWAPPAVRSSAQFSSCCPGDATAMSIRLRHRVAGGLTAPSRPGAAVAAGLPVVQDCATTVLTAEEIRVQVREKYGAAAKRAEIGDKASCGCGCGCVDSDAPADPITSDLYDEAETSGLPAEAVLASLGCGNPTALAQLEPGQVVLDLGSGGGIDVLLSAKRVGPTGKAYGLDMTDEMLDLARANQARSGIDNVEFLKGRIEEIPLPDDSVDVIISNCVINLSADKAQVLREAFRVLRPGGRLAISDVVVRGAVPERVRKNVELWIGCVAGALEESEYWRLLAQAGFTNIDIEPTRIYSASDARIFLEAAGLWDEVTAAAADGRFMSAFIRAVK
jgi:N-acetylglutamate synthase-like GNAT family acetyltransferase/SAM-dependent methyltransferase